MARPASATAPYSRVRYYCTTVTLVAARRQRPDRDVTRRLAPPMALQRALNPELAICARCLDDEDNESRWAPLLSEQDGGALLVRDVCAAPHCPELQVLGHFCRRHAREYDATWRGLYPVRACQICRVGALDLYRRDLDVWFILQPDDDSRTARGVEKRHRTPRAFSMKEEEEKMAARVTRAGGRKAAAPGKRPRRRSSRFHRQHMQKEQLRALEWSLGNIAVPKLHLWKDNDKRIEAEKHPQSVLAAKAASLTPEQRQQLLLGKYSDPTAVFCIVSGCARFAKTGDRCRFHSDGPLLPPGFTLPSPIPQQQQQQSH